MIPVTRAEVSALPAGRALDELVAARVLGCAVQRKKYGAPLQPLAPGDRYFLECGCPYDGALYGLHADAEDGPGVGLLKGFSSDERHAFGVVVPALARRGWRVTVIALVLRTGAPRTGALSWCASVAVPMKRWDDAWAETAALAVARVAVLTTLPAEET